MAAWIKMVMAAGVVVLPGGFVLLFAYAAFRVLHHGWVESQATHGGSAAWKDVAQSVRVDNILREARALF